MSGELFRCEPGTIGTSGAVALKSVATAISGPRALANAIRSEHARARPAGLRPAPPVILAFAESSLSYGSFRHLLGPTLSTHPALHVYLDHPGSPRFRPIS